jgi:hypothetical protein
MHLSAVVAASIAVVAAVIVYRLLPSTNLHTVTEPLIATGDDELVAEFGPVA